MIVVDANVCLYAHDESSPHNPLAQAWLEKALNSDEPVRFPWVTIAAYVRISTDPRIVEAPISTAEAVADVDRWLSAPAGGIVEPTDRHWSLLRGLLAESGARGPLVADAHLAAIALEHGAALATSDRDFRRFLGLRLVDPTRP